MNIIKPYVAESAINPGCAVVQGASDDKVKVSPDGAGDFIGVYDWDPKYRAKPALEMCGITMTGIAKVVAGGQVTAGKKAVMKDDGSGKLAQVPATPGNYNYCGMFLQNAQDGEIVEMLVERGSVTVFA